MSDNLKIAAAAKALSYVKDGMLLGLGSGSTSAEFVKLLGEALKNGTIKDIVGIPTSDATAALARGLGINLTTLDDKSEIDLAIDGADEVDSGLNLIKGLGRALLREKITEIHAKDFIVIVDESKIVNKLGTKGPLPVEIVPFAYGATLKWLETLGCRAEQWLEEDGSPAKTDNGNYLAKCWFENGIDNVAEMASKLCSRPGIVEYGLFIGMASKIIIAGKNGVWEME
jgi:ribose 5-phosphate isomerase A